MQGTGTGCANDEYCEDVSGTCHKKKAENAKTDKHWKCASGKDVCGLCANSKGKIDNGKKCSLDNDCKNDSCGVGSPTAVAGAGVIRENQSHDVACTV